MTPEQLAKVKALLIKNGYIESAMTKNWLCTEDGSDRAADLRKEKPIIGILISGNIVASGHGNLKVEDDIREVDAIMKSKLGTGDTHISKTTAICKDCGTSFETTLDNAQQLMAQFSELYCPKCRGKHETKTPEAIKSAEIKGNVPATPKPEAKPAVIRTCKSCGLELSGARALECYQKEKAFTCEECEEKQNGGTKMETEIVDQNQNLPATKKKQELVIGKCEAVAAQYGIPSEMANLFFMTMDGGLYIKNPGLLYLASKKGYSRIEVTTTFDEKAQEWSAECKIYPKLTKDILEGIGRLDAGLQKMAFEFATQPTNGTGRASKANVRMTTMHAFLKEMSQTRAQNRALRAFTGYGGNSAEELPEAQLERD